MTEIGEKLDKMSSFEYHLTTCIRDYDLYEIEDKAIN